MVTAPALVSAEPIDSDTARLAHLEDLAAIGTLVQAHLREANARLAGVGDRDAITVAADRQAALARIHCIVEREEAIGPEHPLVDMARQQGGGVVRHSESGVFEFRYSRRDGTWTIERSMFVPA